MRTFRHWTARYLLSRAKVYCYQKAHPDLPWLTYQANDFLASYLRPTDAGLEFGSGRSTLWFAERVASLTSVENNSQWYQRVKEQLEEKGASHVTYLYRPEDGGEEDPEKSEYVRVIDGFSEDSLDFVLVDGIFRSDCAQKVIECIRPGGILMLDNSECHVPSDSPAPSARSYTQGPASAKWAEFLQSVENWRIIWTSNGVWDTTIWIRPPHAESAPNTRMSRNRVSV